MASFFVSRVDTDVDRRPEAVGTDEASGLEGRAAVAQAKWLEHLLVDLIDGQGNRSIALALCRVEAVDRAVLVLLVAASDRLLRRGGRLVLRDPSVAVLAGLNRADRIALEVSESDLALDDFAIGPLRKQETPERAATGP